VLVAIIKKRLKTDVSFYTILQILSLIVFEKVKQNQFIIDNAYNTYERDHNNQLILFN